MSDAPEATRIEAARTMSLPAADVFAVLCDPQGHVAIDSSGMLQSADGDPVTAAGDEFVVHMDREALGDLDLGRYDVTVTIRDLEPDRLISWTIVGVMRPPIGHVYGYRLEPAEVDDSGPSTRVTSWCDWSGIHEEYVGSGLFPVISDAALKATLGILERTVRRGYPRG